MERRFWRDELTRTELYESTRHHDEQQLDISPTLSLWLRNEEIRETTFQRFLRTSLEIFTEDQERRIPQFTEVMTRHGEIFSSNNKIRQTTFDNANTTRMGVFSEAQVQRRRIITELAADLKRLYERGRNEREAEVDRLIKSFREMFEDGGTSIHSEISSHSQNQVQLRYFNACGTISHCNDHIRL